MKNAERADINDTTKLNLSIKFSYQITHKKDNANISLSQFSMAVGSAWVQHTNEKKKQHRMEKLTYTYAYGPGQSYPSWSRKLHTKSGGLKQTHYGVIFNSYIAIWCHGIWYSNLCPYVCCLFFSLFLSLIQMAIQPSPFPPPYPFLAPSPLSKTIK